MSGILKNEKLATKDKENGRISMEGDKNERS